MGIHPLGTQVSTVSSVSIGKAKYMHVSTSDIQQCVISSDQQKQDS